MGAHTDTDVRACLNTTRSVPGKIVMLTKGGQLALEDASSETASGTAEVDYVAFSEAVKAMIFSMQVRDQLELPMRISAVGVFEDNKGAINLAVNKHASRRTKYIDVKHHLVRNACSAGKVRVVYIGTENQHVDFFTKRLDI